jgi:hypothetical protein
MNIKAILFLGLFVIVAGGFAAEAEEEAEQNASINAKSTSELFQDILQILPDNAKAKIDSAGKGARVHTTTSPQLSPEITEKINKKDSKEVSKGNDDNVPSDRLPKDIKDQVEKAIRDIEKRNEQKKIELKEFQRNKNINRKQ